MYIEIPSFVAVLDKDEQIHDIESLDKHFKTKNDNSSCKY